MAPAWVRVARPSTRHRSTGLLAHSSSSTICTSPERPDAPEVETQGGHVVSRPAPGWIRRGSWTKVDATNVQLTGDRRER
jgi:hypothetical protein